MKLLSFFRGKTVDFYGDFVDPFGYIGFHNLRLAAEAAGVRIRWRGFELEPETPDEGYQFQTAENSHLRAGMWPSVQGFAQQAGLTIRDPGFAPRTQLAHRLALNLPEKSGQKYPLIEAIYQAYLNEQKNIGERPILIEIAEKFGVSKQVAINALNKTQHHALARHRAEAAAHRFPGMPAYRFRNQTLFGALPSAHWRQVFKS